KPSTTSCAHSRGENGLVRKRIFANPQCIPTESGSSSTAALAKASAPEESLRSRRASAARITAAPKASKSWIARSSFRASSFWRAWAAEAASDPSAAERQAFHAARIPSLESEVESAARPEWVANSRMYAAQPARDLESLPSPICGWNMIGERGAADQ